MSRIGTRDNNYLKSWHTILTLLFVWANVITVYLINPRKSTEKLRNREEFSKKVSNKINTKN